MRHAQVGPGEWLQPGDGLPRLTAGGVLATVCGVSQQLTPRAAGVDGPRARLRAGPDALHQDPGEQLVTPRAGPVHLPDRAEQLRRAARPAVVRRDLLGLAAGDQAVQVEPDGVRVHAELAGN